MPTSRLLPDIAPVGAPLVGALLAAADALEAGWIDVPGFQARTLELLRALPPREALATHIAHAADERRHQVLARRRGTAHSDCIQVSYLAQDEAQPCRCHNNAIALQLVLTGMLHAREFDRVGTAGGGGVLLRLVFDGRLGPGGAMQASEHSRNAHWFAAVDGPATLLEMTLLGCERATFYAPGQRPLGAVLLDPTRTTTAGLVLGVPISEAEARRRFARRPLDAFPMPPAPDGAVALRLEPA